MSHAPLALSADAIPFPLGAGAGAGVMISIPPGAASAVGRLCAQMNLWGSMSETNHQNIAMQNNAYNRRIIEYLADELVKEGVLTDKAIEQIRSGRDVSVHGLNLPRGVLDDLSTVVEMKCRNLMARVIIVEDGDNYCDLYNRWKKAADEAAADEAAAKRRRMAKELGSTMASAAASAASTARRVMKGGAGLATSFAQGVIGGGDGGRPGGGGSGGAETVAASGESGGAETVAASGGLGGAGEAAASRGSGGAGAAAASRGSGGGGAADGAGAAGRAGVSETKDGGAGAPSEGGSDRESTAAEAWPSKSMFKNVEMPTDTMMVVACNDNKRCFYNTSITNMKLGNSVAEVFTTYLNTKASLDLDENAAKKYGIIVHHDEETDCRVAVLRGNPNEFCDKIINNINGVECTGLETAARECALFSKKIDHIEAKKILELILNPGQHKVLCNINIGRIDSASNRSIKYNGQDMSLYFKQWTVPN